MKKRAASRPTFLTSTYLQEAQLPLTALVFLLPMIILYEIGTRHSSSDIIAFTLMQDFFGWFGAYGRRLPALAVVAILLAWHLARNDAWKVSPLTLGCMAVESAALAAPLLLLDALSAQRLPLSSPGNGMLIMALGAGIYEELVFRLIAFTLLSLVLMDLLELRRWPAYLPLVLVPATLFSAYHYLGPEPFQLRSFAFRTLAGAYFGVVFLFRGFGVTAGSHAAYDIMVVLLSGGVLGG